jgi:hypothetical protein
MRHKFFTPILLAFLVLILASSACGTSAPTIAVTNTLAPTLTPTATSIPTSTATPTPTPNAAATEFANRSSLMLSEIQPYFDEGYIPSVEGRYIELQDFKQDWAQLGWYKWWDQGVTVSTYVYNAHFSWSSAYRNADISGCGIRFNSGYTVFLDRSGILILDITGYPLGKTSGKGRVKFTMPAQADFTLIVNDEEGKAHVIVDNQYIGLYTVKKNSALRDLSYSILSGTNKDFGTHCEITNARLWKIK